MDRDTFILMRLTAAFLQLLQCIPPPLDTDNNGDDQTDIYGLIISIITSLWVPPPVCQEPLPFGITPEKIKYDSVCIFISIHFS